jgi:saccharopine dehydrogenase-like NADP-dependent oxidoreductase
MEHIMVPSDIKKILVVGATGGVGKLISREIIRLLGADSLIAGDYNLKRADKFTGSLERQIVSRYIDVHDRESIVKALKGVHAVIVAARQIEPNIQSLCIKRQIPCLDITAYPEFVEKVQALNSHALSFKTPLIMMAGLFPGLSGIMAKEAAKKLDQVASIDVGLLQSTQGTVGATGLADMLDWFSQPVIFKKGGKQHVIPGFSMKRSFVYPEFFGEKRQRLVRFHEASVVSEKLSVSDVNYWTSFDQESFNLLLSCLKKTGFLKLFHFQTTRIKLGKIINLFKSTGKPKPEKIAVTIEVSGYKEGKTQNNRISIIAPSDYGTTAMSAVAMIKLILAKYIDCNGACFPLEVFPLDLLLEIMDCEDIKLFN